MTIETESRVTWRGHNFQGGFSPITPRLLDNEKEARKLFRQLKANEGLWHDGATKDVKLGTDRHRVDGEVISKSTSFPVFYDKSGKRLRRLVMAAFAFLCVITVVVVSMAPSVLGSAWPNTRYLDDGWARRTLGAPGMVPAIGDVEHGVLTRLVRVERGHLGTGALPGPDPALLEQRPPADEDGDGVPEEPEQLWLPEPPLSPLKLVDPVTDEFVRYALDEERDTIGDAPFVVEHHGAVPDHTLVLTFDDGPDASYTPQILDILSREHVPATFFVIGENLIENPEVFQRLIREGHMAGNHTMSHLDFDTQSDFRNQQEIIQTDRIMRSTAGYASPVFRIPTGWPEAHPLAQLKSQQLGYINADMDVDTKDWHYQPGEEIPVPPLDGRGHVVLLHDGGGDRASTVKMLERLIAEAKAQGYTFTTLQPLLPSSHVPLKNISPSIADRTSLRAFHAVWVAPGRLFGFLFWFGAGSLVTMSLVYLLLAVLNEVRQRRRNWPDCSEEELPFVSVVLAAYNEDKVIARTIDTLRKSDYPQSRFEIVAVNDGSSDQTLPILQEYALRYPQLRVVDQENSGKSSAVNNGINHARPRSTVIVSMDADTLFRSDTIRMLARHFVGNPRMGAVAGHVKVGNRRNILTAWQSLEYISGICVTRMAEQTMGAIGIVPGACSAWSRQALEQIGGFCEDTLAEDADATLELQKRGYAVVNENKAIADTEAPETVVALAKQRKRWTFGSIQVLWKHKAMMLRPKYGWLGMVILPYATLSLLVPIIFMPATILAAGASLASGNWHNIAIFAGCVAAIHLIIATIGIAIARETFWHLLVVPYYRLVYEPLRFYLLYASVYRALKGTVVAWDKLERRNTVAATL